MVSQTIFIRYSMLALLSLVSLLSLPAYADQVTAALDKNVVRENEVVQLTVRTDFANTNGGPDFSVLKRDFEILSRSQNSQFSFNLGTNQALNFWVVTLMPKAVGNFNIPPIQVGDQASEPLSLEVKPAQQMTDANGNPLVMIKFTADTLEPYVQQQVKLSLELYTATDLQSAQLSTPNHPNLLLERLSDDQMRYEEVNGTSYQVLTREYVGFAQRSGTIELTNQSVEAMVNGRNGRRKINVKSTPITLNVLPIPASYGNTNWLPTQALAVKSNVSTTLSNPRIGDTLMWNIDISAQGVLGEQLPVLSFASTRAYKLYPTSPSYDTSKNMNGVMGRESISIEVVPTQSGTLQLPDVEVTYWDPQERAIKTVTASTNAIQIAGLPNGNATDNTSNNQAGAANDNSSSSSSSESVAPISLAKRISNNIENSDTSSTTAGNAPTPLDVVLDPNQESSWAWQSYAALALLLLGIAGLGTWIALYRRQRQSQGDDSVPTLQEFAPLQAGDEQSAFINLIAGCRAHDLSTLRANLLEWARHRWGDDAIRGVEDIKRLANNPRLTQLLMEAELVMYSASASDSWNGDALADALEEYSTGQAKPSKASQLQALYPNF
ncbi:BatD family protein [Marinomonas ostreistagni]|uniref:BatD family protein n=1 Tax=Marinomonas ostreistagni TaxID=359209 RepID=UPI001950431B|nr:BatD family protein [Marinomonas ostreistagni]MBM6551937.1 BatD family protein [Marinomonas ostreistagni]